MSPYPHSTLSCINWVRFFAFWEFGAIMLKRGGADFVVMLALIDSTWKFMLVWNGAALRSILLNEIYDLADIHFLQFIAYISASLSIRFQPFFHVYVMMVARRTMHIDAESFLKEILWWYQKLFLDTFLDLKNIR